MSDKKKKQSSRESFSCERLMGKGNLSCKTWKESIPMHAQGGKFLKKEETARSMSLVPTFYDRVVEKDFLMFDKEVKSMH